MRTLPTVVVSLTAALGAAISGFQYGRVVESKSSAVFDLMAHESFLATQREAALALSDDFVVEQALWLQLGALRAFESRHAIPAQSNGTAMESALIYARLADLALRQNDGPRSASLLSQAEAICPKSASPNCSASTLLSITRIGQGARAK